uniref:Uncharacterized protein n=1 Tax=Oryza sativa subsp. japonica TaxID=39947 RepID=Q6YT96_ORYSJ|nr:hypothetical protein [Oryza sativa Japonica Group]
MRGGGVRLVKRGDSARGWRREEATQWRTSVDGDGDLFPSDVRALCCLLAGISRVRTHVAKYLV